MKYLGYLSLASKSGVYGAGEKKCCGGSCLDDEVFGSSFYRSGVMMFSYKGDNG